MKKKPDKIPTSWKEKIIKPIEIGPEPPLNREGFWKKFENEEPKITTYND